MSTSSAISMMRQLDRIAIDTHRAEHPAGWRDILQRAQALADDVAAFNIADMTCVWHLRQAELWLRLDQYDAARLAAEQGRAALGTLRKGDLLVDALVIEARAYAALQDWNALDRIAEIGISVVEEFRFHITGDYLRAGYLRKRITLYALGVQAAFMLRDIDKVVRRAELSKCRLVAQDPDAASPALRVELKALSARISDAERAGRDTGSLRAKRQTLWDQHSRETAAAPLPVLNCLRDAQDTLNLGEAVLYYYWIDRHTVLRLIFDGQHAAMSMTTLDHETRSALDAYTAELAKERPDRSADFDIDDLDMFTAVLWPGDVDGAAILEGAARLIISPHRVLHALPFAALRLGNRYVIERWSVRHAPNLGTLMQHWPSDRRKSVVAVGIGDYHLPDQALSPLKNAPSEAEGIATLYAQNGWQTAVLTGPTDEVRLSKTISMSDPCILHLACHSESVNADTPLESHLFLSHTRLDGLEIPFLGLSAQTIILSACSAGQRAISGRKMVELPGDDLQGLQAAFFAAGARQIVATLFSVKDYAAPLITKVLHQRLLQGDPADIALAQAIRAYLDEHFGPPHADRAYWAPFYLVALGPNQNPFTNSENSS
ncbi:MAG: CHAT domain-containing protein [Pseudomonadota bacterium]